ncbi:hypothetical protein PGUG_01876 [Meyerozyma guilliermondii ATCC 6260]|uniref:Uncharacterized protein n=1 Tax=Meyerozyma guilliermondii (strain ATCC 6260 / CBS 566 / DSM 6381 / JCM 1539 / NBRC 10279 / NRRL Y-324) TaxID=294746 RepID=A5DF25_PICGU|nr:uncharacterized protein PGUG_01876 [Meyerozyma guilliermondii ATCC 6260]EDK37779.2 hypothetical protein PGUG_01876 [Meyerozyma guilliermondii ATCC 6260]
MQAHSFPKKRAQKTSESHVTCDSDIIILPTLYLSSLLNLLWNSLVRLDSRGWDNLVLILGLGDQDSIGQSLRANSGGSWVLHNLDSDTQNTLSHQHVSDGNVNKVVGWLTRVDHETVRVLLRLGSSSSQFTGDDNLHTLSTSSHGKSQHTVGGSSHWQTVQQLGFQGFGLDSSGQTSLLDSLGVDDNSFRRQLESLDNQGGQLVDSTSLFSQNTLGVGSLDNNLQLGWGLSDLNTGVTLFSQFSGEEFVQLGVEDTISYQLSFLGQNCVNHFLVYERM